MIIKGLVEEDFVNYKKPSMYIPFPHCSFKCDREYGCTICQNSTLVNSPNYDIPVEKIIEKYLNNPISQAVVIAGLEPLDDITQLLDFILAFREKTQDDIVIYTGYTEEEVNQKNFLYKNLEIKLLNFIVSYGNIIVKFGRFIPNKPSHYDEILGVNLASPNQYAKKW